MKKILLKILLAIACIIFWVLVFIQNIVPSGKFEASTDFNNTNPWLPGLRPIERVVNRNTIIGDPIYLDIKLPTRFDQLRVRLNYENQSGGDFRVGIFTNKDKWQILFAKQQDGEYVFDLRGLSLEKNIIPIVFGAPKATTDKPVIIKKMEIIASKPALGLERLRQQLISQKGLFFGIAALLITAVILFFIILPITASVFTVILVVGSFFDAALLELWRPGFVANFVDSRIFILLFFVVSFWYWLEHKRKN